MPVFYEYFLMIFLLPMKFLIYFKICSTTLWVPIDLHSSRFIRYLQSLILGKLFVEKLYQIIIDFDKIFVFHNYSKDEAALKILISSVALPAQIMFTPVNRSPNKLAPCVPNNILKIYLFVILLHFQLFHWQLFYQ